MWVPRSEFRSSCLDSTMIEPSPQFSKLSFYNYTFAHILYVCVCAFLCVHAHTRKHTLCEADTSPFYFIDGKLSSERWNGLVEMISQQMESLQQMEAHWQKKVLQVKPGFQRWIPEFIPKYSLQLRPMQWSLAALRPQPAYCSLMVIAVLLKQTVNKQIYACAYFCHALVHAWIYLRSHIYIKEHT